MVYQLLSQRAQQGVVNQERKGRKVILSSKERWIVRQAKMNCRIHVTSPLRKAGYRKLMGKTFQHFFFINKPFSKQGLSVEEQFKSPW